jgi:selenocysteine-specific elongation factor
LRVIGTAGHVDHGKSTLIEALTGTHPDRLQEERAREMTIVLGFAWWTLPNGEEVGVVDVPGHRDFIENMLSGVGGIDAALFVVAADEGVMPQTKEHLSILDILQIQAGVIALAKVDLVDDPEWLDLVEEEVRQAVQDTVLADAPIVRVSAKTRVGLGELESALQEVLGTRPPRVDLGRPRLPIDRVFTMSGFGTVVTGTLTDGNLRVGDEVEILPGDGRGRVRGLQTHQTKEDLAVPGSRTAVNISGVDVDDVQRGQVLAYPGTLQATRRLDLRFRLLSDIEQPLLHNTEVKLFIGAAEVVGRLRLLGADSLLPGDAGWIQLELREPVVAVRGDRYILRRPSPAETLGGGVVVDAQPKRRHKRFNEAALARLDVLLQGTPADVLMQASLALGPASLVEVVKQSNLEAEMAQAALDELLSTGQLVIVDGEDATINSKALVSNRGVWESLAANGLEEVKVYHQANPLRRGMPREEMKSRWKLPPRLFNALVNDLVQAEQLMEFGPLVSLPAHNIQFSAVQQTKVDTLLARFAAEPFTPPSVKEASEQVGDDVFAALVDLGDLQLVSPEVAFRKADFERMVAELRTLIETNGPVTVAQVRDHLGTTRRYVLAFLEYLDAIGVTTRDGDERSLN